MDNIQEWITKIKSGEQFKKDYADSDMWNTFYSYYKNKYEKGILPINLIYSIGRSIIPQVYFNNPGVSITSTIPGYDTYTKVLETLINRLFFKLKIKNVVKKVILHTYLYGTGIFKIGYGSYWNGLKENVSKRRYNMDYGNYDLETPWLKYVNPKQYFIPYGTEVMKDKMWECFTYYRFLDDAHNDPIYSNERKNLTATTVTPADFSSVLENTGVLSEKESYVKIYEIHDYRDGKVKIFGEGLDKWLFYNNDISQEHGTSSINLSFNEDPEIAWGISDCTILYPQQIEINEIRTQNMQHRRLALIKFLYLAGAIEDAELNRLLSGEVGPAIKINGNLSSSITTFQPHIPNDFYIAQDKVREDIRELVGFSRNQIGEYDTSSRRTAYETMTVAQSAGIRIDERRDILADALIEVAEIFISYITRYWNEYKVEQTVGVDGAIQWVRYNPSFLNKSYLTCKIDLENQIPSTKLIKRRDAIDFMQILKGSPDINQTELIKWIASFYDGINLNALLNPVNQPINTVETAEDIDKVNQEWNDVDQNEGISSNMLLDILQRGGVKVNE